MKIDELTVLDRLCMEALTQAMRHTSVVSLAAAMWNPDRRNLLGGDPVGLTQFLIESLNERGLVNYVIRDRTGGQHSPWAGLAVNIRLTRDGWELMGYPQIHAQVFTRLSTSVYLPGTGDMTNFRKHGHSAVGGDIEVDTFADHQVLFPQHVHDYEMAGDDMATRRYLRMTEEIENEIRDYAKAHPDLTHIEIADALAYSDRTIKYVLTDLPRIRRSTDDTEHTPASQKQRIIWALQMADYENVTSLRKTLGRTDTAHDIVHALHDLQTEGKVDFIEKGDRKEPIRIHLTDRGHAFAVKTAATEDIAEEVAPPPIEKSEEVGYPILDALLEREKRRLDGDTKALQYIAAAELIRDNDPETAALLDAKAEELDIPYPSPIEAEYMRHVAEHP